MLKCDSVSSITRVFRRTSPLPERAADPSSRRSSAGSDHGVSGGSACSTPSTATMAEGSRASAPAVGSVATAGATAPPAAAGLGSATSGRTGCSTIGLGAEGRGGRSSARLIFTGMRGSSTGGRRGGVSKRSPLWPGSVAPAPKANCGRRARPWRARSLSVWFAATTVPMRRSTTRTTMPPTPPSARVAVPPTIEPRIPPLLAVTCSRPRSASSTIRTPAPGRRIRRRSAGDQTMAAAMNSVTGTSAAPQPSSARSDVRHQCSTEPWSVSSAMIVSTPRSATATAPISARSRACSRGPLRRTGRALVQERGEALVDGVLERRRLREVRPGLGSPEALDDLLLRLLEEVGRILLGDEALRHDVRARDDGSRLLLDGDDHEEDAFVADRQPVAHHRLADVPHPEAVDVHLARRDVRADARAARVDLHDVAVRDDEGVLLGDADVDRHARVPHEHPVFAVDRDEETRAQDVQEQLQLLLARMTRDVWPARAVVDAVGAAFEQVVDGAAHELLVARDRVRRHTARVAVLHGDVAMVAKRHARQRARGLALATGRDDADLMIGQLRELRRMHDRALRVLEVAEVARGLRVVLHRPPDDRGPATPGVRDLDDLLDPRDVRRECRRDHAAGSARHDRVEDLADMSLGRRVARDLGAGRVR